MGQLTTNRKLVFLSILILSLCVVASGTGIWLIAHRLSAETLENTMVDSEPENRVFAGYCLKLVPDYLNKYGYLVLTSRSEGEDTQAEYTIVPTRMDLDFNEMIISLETLLWQASKWEFNTEYANNLKAQINLGYETNTFKLTICQVTPWDFKESERPSLAIVIDDWGNSSSHAAGFLQYPFPLTTAILPFLPKSFQLAVQLGEKGHEVILHQPMEPLNEYLDIGRGGILSSMDEIEIRSNLEKNLQHLPMVVGVNNHMGSKATAEIDVMEAVLKTLKERGLYFLDSSTTTMSVVDQKAPVIGIPYAINNQFIDNVNQVDAIKQELRKSIQRALNHGSAIAIGHVRPATAEALWEMIPEFVMAGIQIVPVSKLLIYPKEESEIP